MDRSEFEEQRASNEDGYYPDCLIATEFGLACEHSCPHEREMRAIKNINADRCDILPRPLLDGVAFRQHHARFGRVD
jgi:hypothetical protein